MNLHYKQNIVPKSNPVLVVLGYSVYKFELHDLE